MAKPYRYDVFISYKSEQESWARRLADTLAGFGLKVWRDKDGGIGIGEIWTTEIQIGIRESKRMIVIWSDLIIKNLRSVVHTELREMNNLITGDPERSFVPIMLDGASLNDILSPFQGDQNLIELHRKYGDEGAHSVSAIEWFQALKPLIEALGLTNITEVRIVVAAMTNSQAQELLEFPDRFAHNRPAFDLMCSVMDLTSKYKTDRYGESPDEWIPFPQLGENWTIREIIDIYDYDKRSWCITNEQAANWIIVSYSDEIISSNPDIREKAREDIQSGPCLIIVDPVSLMHKDVYQTIIISGGLQNHSRAFFLGIAPFISQMHSDVFGPAGEVEKMLNEVLEAAYASFKKPFEPPERACVMNIEHEFQFLRWIQVAADTIVRVSDTPMRARRMDPRKRKHMERLVPSAPPSSILSMGTSS
jgi:hypothetical protein